MATGLTVLTDEQIRFILEKLTVEELEGFRNELRHTLHRYSTTIQSDDAALLHQPERTSVHSNATGATTLWMPSSSPAAHAVKVITLSGAGSEGPDDPRPPIKPSGAITLFGPDGKPVGLLDASAMTAFRTALASACLLIRRNHVKTITVFGAGEQAYWHIRLALKLRGSSIKQVHIINRKFSEGCKTVLHRFYATPKSIKEAEGWADTEFGILTPQYGEYSRLLANHVMSADVIFCCTPSKVPLFDPSILTSHEGRRKGRLIVAIGSYTPDMQELPVELLKQATKSHEEKHYHFHKHAIEGGVIIVDTLDGALKEAGEIIAAELKPRQLVELGELVMIQAIVMNDEDQGSESRGSLTVPSAEFEKLDVSHGDAPVVSTVHGSTDDPKSSSSSLLSRPSSRAASPDPSRRKSATFPKNFHRRSSSYGGPSKEKKTKDNHLARWLQGGNVIYKSVGLGLMDLAVGVKLVQFAREKGIGTHIEGF